MTTLTPESTEFRSPFYAELNRSAPALITNIDLWLRNLENLTYEVLCQKAGLLADLISTLPEFKTVSLPKPYPLSRTGTRPDKALITATLRGYLKFYETFLTLVLCGNETEGESVDTSWLRFGETHFGDIRSIVSPLSNKLVSSVKGAIPQN